MTQKRRVEAWLQWASAVVPLLVAPALLFPRVEWMVLGLSVPAVWVGNYWVKRHFVASTPLNLLLFPLLVMVLVSVYVTFDVEFSLAKVAGTLLGVFVFFGLVQFVDRSSRLWLGIGSFCFGGVLFALVSLVVTNWEQARKDRLLPDLSQMFPIRFRGLPGLEGGLNPNPVGGTLVLFIPLLLLLALYLVRKSLPARWATAIPSLGNLPAHRIATALLGASAIASLILLLAIVLFTHSRSAWLGCTLAVWFLLFVYFLRFRWGTLAVILVPVILLWVFQVWGEVWKEISEAVEVTRGLPRELQGAGRVDLWLRAIDWIQEFPFTGIGMNNFRKVMHVLYHRDMASAHNHILQVALDVGIPGMVVYVGLWSAMARLLWMVSSRSGDRLKRVVAMGLGAGLLAQFVYQTTDAIPLGAKVGIFWWIALGLAVSMFLLVEREGVIDVLCVCV